MCQELPVNLLTAVTICETIEGLLRDSIGPNALHTMLTSPSGRVVITGDGLTILTSLHLSHPIARWILQHVKSHHDVTGDNSKSFVLIVTELLRQLQDAVSLKSTSSDSSSKQDLIAVSQALETIHSEIFPEVVLPELRRHCVCLDLVEEKRGDLRSMSRKIVRTSLGGKFTMHATNHVAELIVELVCGSCQDVGNLAETMQGLINDYDVGCLEVPNQPVSKSKLLDGVVCTRNFAFQSDDLDTLTTVPFVILSCSLDKWTPDVRSTLAAKSTRDLTMFLELGTSRTQSLIEHLKECGVMLVLSSELLSDATLSFCRAARISAVHMIPEEELSRLARLTKTDIVYDSTDILRSTLKIGSAKFCGSVMVGQNIGVHLGFSDERVRTKQLVLCAPTQGICRQWFMAVLNALKTLRMWLDTSFVSAVPMRDGDNINKTSSRKSNPMTVECECVESLDQSSARRCGSAMQDTTGAPDALILESDLSPTNNSQQKTEMCKPQGICIPGGGCTEFLLHRILSRGHDRDWNLNLKDPALSTAIGILRDAALCIPRTLHRNSFSPKSRKSSFLEIVSKVRHCNALISVNGRTGALCDNSDAGVWEAMSARYMLWRDAIKTVQDLLRIDMIVGIKEVQEDHSNTDDEDSD
ncbi:Bardet-Biedl syndrome 10 protein homolog [Patiria miniata]|uniref:Uncharacterized protein n=1 Tax=Patiria miniata TaxID=46514 RepID=A0A914B242_PATMI|nr:Bardet-Biedl syndrome 10 protein homolog [Patiria miniata]XP_038070077.1 Bardet-Biedl syndrome 10 protein homolog [Patiria miniata]